MEITILQGIAYLCYVMAGLQLLYYLLFFSRLALYRPAKKEKEEMLPPVSVIVCARNEEKNLKENLPKVLEQQYPGADKEENYEVVVINDHSEDGTIFYLREKASRYSHFRYTNITQKAKGIPGKKYPLTIGIKGAINEIVVLTDADCRPAGSKWLAKMGAGFSGGKEIVLGYGAYERRKGLLNRVIRFETFFSGMQYLSFALAGVPYMGVGRNLAYKKKLFFQHKGFLSHMKIPSGDDDLFINAAANRKNTAVVLDKEAITYSKPEEKWRDWYRQKRRHVSTGRHYKFKHRFLLGLFSLSLFLYYPLFVVALFYKPLFYITLGVFVGKLMVQAVVWARSLKKLNERGLFWLCFPFEVLMCLYYLIFTPALMLKPKKRWN